MQTKNNFVLKTNVLLQKKHPGPRDTRIFRDFDFAVCGGVFCTFAYDRGLFAVMFLHFRQKYRCVPKIGFSADISIDICVGISIDIFIGMSSVILLTRRRKERGRSGSFF